MTSWPSVPIKQCARVVGGATPKSGVLGFWDGDTSWVTPKDLSDLDGKFIHDTPRKISQLGLNSCSAELLPADSVLFSSRAPIGHVAINTRPMATNQGFKSFVPGEKLDPSFLYWWLKVNRSQLEQLGNGATFKEVSKAVVERIEILLPPRDEQKRIAAILDQADELRRKRKHALRLLEALPQAIFCEDFGYPVAPEPQFPSVPLSRVADLINGDRSGNYPSGDDLVASGVLFLGTKNINGSEIDLSTCNFITEQKFRSLSQGKLRRHDLVITLRGTLGQCAEFDCSYDTGFINAQMMIIRPRDRLLPKYLREFIAHPRTQALLKRDSSGSAIPQLTGRQVGELLVPVPPRDAQELFCRRASQVRAVLSYSVEHLAKLDTLFASLQHRVFTGELSSKDVERELAIAG